jgi:hypothetical protein
VLSDGRGARKEPDRLDTDVKSETTVLVRACPAANTRISLEGIAMVNDSVLT